MSSRLQVTLHEEDWELIETIQKLCKLESNTEVIEEALVLLGWAAVKASEGFSISAVDEDNKRYREVETKALQRARRKPQQAVAM